MKTADLQCEMAPPAVEGLEIRPLSAIVAWILRTPAAVFWHYRTLPAMPFWKRRATLYRIDWLRDKRTSRPDGVRFVKALESTLRGENAPRPLDAAHFAQMCAAVIPTPVVFARCEIVRRKLVKTGVFSLVNREIRDEKKQWVVEPCGTTLFYADEIAGGACRSCLHGWASVENYPVARAAEFEKLIEPLPIAPADLVELAAFNACGDPQPGGWMLVGAAGGPYRMTERDWIEYVALCRAQEKRAAHALATEM